jgi:hypothetical protein
MYWALIYFLDGFWQIALGTNYMYLVLRFEALLCRAALLRQKLKLNTSPQKRNYFSTFNKKKKRGKKKKPLKLSR